MKGKDKCRILKEIRAQIARENGIEWAVENCTHKGDCKGTCPKCESEVRALERELERKRALGRTVVLAGISASLMMSSMSCDALEREFLATDGDMEIEQTTTKENINGGVLFPPESIDGDYAEEGDLLSDEWYYDSYASIGCVYYYVALSDITLEHLYGYEYPDGDGINIIKAGEKFSVVGIHEDSSARLVLFKDSHFFTYQEVIDDNAGPDEGGNAGNDESTDSGTPDDTAKSEEA